MVIKGQKLLKYIVISQKDSHQSRELTKSELSEFKSFECIKNRLTEKNKFLLENSKLKIAEINLNH